MGNDGAMMWRESMFPKINPLPGPKTELAAADRDREIHRSERGADVRRHVVVPFGGVDEEGIPVRDKPGEELL